MDIDENGLPRSLPQLYKTFLGGFYSLHSNVESDTQVICM
jgi:hypothetical protein